MSISLLSEKEGNQDEIERRFERWREHEERWRVSRREREEKESVEERDCDNFVFPTSSSHQDGRLLIFMRQLIYFRQEINV